MEKENKLLLMIGGLIVLALIGAFLGIRNREKKIPSGLESGNVSTIKDPGGALIEVPLLTPVHEHFTDPVAHYTFDVTYPTIALAQQSDLAKDANTVISTFVHHAVDDFKANTKDAYSPSLGNDLESDETMTYRPLLLSPTIISIRLAIPMEVACTTRYSP